MTLRIIEDWIELDGVRVAKLLPNTTLSLLDLLNDKFEEINDYDDDDVDVDLDKLLKEIEQMRAKRGKIYPRIKTLAARMAKAKMRVISTEKDQVK